VGVLAEYRISHGLQVSQIHCDGLQLESINVVVVMVWITLLLLLLQNIFHCHLGSRGTSTCQVNCGYDTMAAPIVDHFTGIEVTGKHLSYI
jgi:hypothetical protein